ncbi:hypothetical protein Pst134EB_029946 [Puccinia striiformis f. sp. tritici]|nr:hypothetical protein Pst134EB_029946 [Puccinia striiformis f. sp. tritici]
MEQSGYIPACRPKRVRTTAICNETLLHRGSAWSLVLPKINMSITYRQLHAKKIGPQHPLRVIAHCDVDAAYAQFEQVRLKIPPDKPLAVQQWRGLIAVNYPARAFGITRHLDFDEAKKLCPDLICVHVATYAQGDSSETEAKYHDNPKPETHKVSLDPYRRESVKILKIFSESCQTIEKASIDEAFLDFSIPVREIICERYGLPTLEDLQDPTSKINMDDPLPDPPSDLDWDGLVQSSNSSVVPLDDNDNDKHSGSETRHPHTWSDIALLIGAELMAECRSKVFHQLGYTCSAGIATNKMLAKLCSAYKKPDAQTILRQSVADLINDSPEKKGCTLSEVWKLTLAHLQAGLGEDTGIWVWEIVRGIDRSEVEIKTQVKSMMSSKNFRPSIHTWDQGLHWIRILSRDLFARLSEARIVTPGIWPKSIVMHKRDGTHTSYAKQISFPYTSKLTDEYIYMYGQKLLQEFSVKDQVQGSTSSRSSGYKLGAITSLALAFQSLDRIEVGQRGIQGFFAPHPIAPNFSSTQSTTTQTSPIDPASSCSNQTRDLSSTSTVQPPEELELDSHAHLSSSSIGKTSSFIPFSCSLENRESSSSKPPELKTGSSTNKKQKRSTNPSSPSPTPLKFICPRCQEIITLDPLPPLHTDLVYEEEDDEEKKIRFERLKNVHLDHHFALDLSNQDQQASSSSNIHPNQSSSATNRPQSKNRIKNQKDILPSSSGPVKSSHSNTTATTTTTNVVGSGNRGIKDFFKPVPSGPVLPKSKKRKK